MMSPFYWWLKMAERRMFAKTIVDSDAFLEMPLSTQALYFHLSMRADDDGFINNPKKIMRMIGANDDDLKVLFTKKFILGFDSGVIVIKHWRLHNYIRSDRYKPTLYNEEMAKLIEKNNKVYTLDTVGIPSDIPSDIPVVTTGKDRLGKVRLDKVRIGEYNTIAQNAHDRDQLFSEFWDDYGKKVDKSKCEKKFKKISNSDIDKIKKHLPLYIKSTPDIQYRKNPLTYLNGKCWNDEVVISKEKNSFNKQMDVIDELISEGWLND